MYVRIGFRLSSLDVGTCARGYVDWVRFWVAARARAQLGLGLGLGLAVRVSRFGEHGAGVNMHVNRHTEDIDWHH